MRQALLAVDIQASFTPPEALIRDVRRLSGDDAIRGDRGTT
jgi:hypothetical protein